MGVGWVAELACDLPGGSVVEVSSENTACGFERASEKNNRQKQDRVQKEERKRYCFPLTFYGHYYITYPVSARSRETTSNGTFWINIGDSVEGTPSPPGLPLLGLPWPEPMCWMTLGVVT